VNTATVTTDQTTRRSPVTGHDHDHPEAVVSITKTVDQASVSAPGTLNYTILVTNTGNTDLTTVA